MSQIDMQPSGIGALGRAAIAIVIGLVVITVVYWGVTHRPVRQRADDLPPAMSDIQAQTARQQAVGGAAAPTPTLGPNDVLVYTVDGRDVCSGYPIGKLGYHLRCGAPAGVHLFRVVDQAGQSTLAVRYTDQVLIRVGR